MLTTKSKSGKSGNKNSSLDPSKRPGESRGKQAPGKKENIAYPRESEAANQREGADPTFTARNDVTPPNKKEFPSVGPAKADFGSRPHGRTTGRMIGHEPGTESV